MQSIPQGTDDRHAECDSEVLSLGVVYPTPASATSARVTRVLTRTSRQGK